jgi:hypothetical protein
LAAAVVDISRAWMGVQLICSALADPRPAQGAQAMSILNGFARVAGIIAIVLITGFWGIVFTFSDYPASWSTLQWTAYVVAWHLPGAFVVGYLARRRWLWGLAVTWGALFILTIVVALEVAGVLIAAVAASAYAGGYVFRMRNPTSRASTMPTSESDS